MAHQDADSNRDCVPEEIVRGHTHTATVRAKLLWRDRAHFELLLLELANFGLHMKPNISNLRHHLYTLGEEEINCNEIVLTLRTQNMCCRHLSFEVLKVKLVSRRVRQSQQCFSRLLLMLIHGIPAMAFWSPLPLQSRGTAPVSAPCWICSYTSEKNNTARAIREEKGYFYHVAAFSQKPRCCTRCHNWALFEKTINRKGCPVTSESQNRPSRPTLICRILLHHCLQHRRGEAVRDIVQPLGDAHGLL